MNTGMFMVCVIPIFTETIIKSQVQLETNGRLLATPRKGEDLVVAVPLEDTARCSLFNMGLINHVAPLGESGRVFVVRTRESGGLDLRLKLADGIQATVNLPMESVRE